MKAPHSRVTGLVRLTIAVLLMALAVRTLADPARAVAEQGMPMGDMLPVAGLSFSLGVFLLTGFATRACGLILAGLAVWQIATFGAGPVSVLEALAGVYLVLRGGGAWAMDIYVQKMQDRVRQKSLSSPESS
ncbi:MAG TPA: hypothetical protein VF937_16600 [Chloroflexota bacterium]